MRRRPVDLGLMMSLSLAGCFEEGSSANVTSSGSSSSSSGGSTSTSGSTTAPVDSSTTATPDPTTSTTTDSSSEGSSSSSGGPPVVVFFDDFERADDQALGNGWAEKSATAWSLLGGQVIGEPVGGGFRDNLLYRPELSMLDVVVGAQFALTTTAEADFPQIEARIAPGDPGELFGYGLHIHPTNNDLQLFRYEGPSFEVLVETPLLSPVTAGQVYRLRFQVIGSEPVDLHGWAEQRVDGRWEPYGELVFLDGDPSQFAIAGTVGLSGNANHHIIIYDDFEVRAPDGS